jgi:hypothetical protein
MKGLEPSIFCRARTRHELPGPTSMTSPTVQRFRVVLGTYERMANDSGF